MKMAMGKTIDDILNDEALNWLLGYLEDHQWNDAIWNPRRPMAL